MKKWIAILLVALFVLTLAACRRKDSGTEANDQPGQPVSDIKESVDIIKDDVETEPEANEKVDETNVEPDSDDHTATEPESGRDAEGDPVPENKAESTQSNEEAAPAGSTGQSADSDYDPDDASEDVEVDDFTGLDTKDDEVIEIGEGEGVGGF